jgi:hypothetical protein
MAAARDAAIAASSDEKDACGARDGYAECEARVVGAITSLGSSAFSGKDIRSAVTINAAGDYIVAGGATVTPYIGYAPIAGGSATTLPSGALNPRVALII